MQCTKPMYLKQFGFYVPCNKCLACRISRRREWSLRLIHQNMYMPATFFTLTYDNNYLPLNGLQKRDFQLFFKRFRKRFKDKTVKYFGCGEYGDNFRAHYHAIIFGVPYNDILQSSSSALAFKRSKHLYHSCVFPFWNFGYCVISSCSVDTIEYVCGYVTKKLKSYTDTYKSLGLNLPFQLQSQGLGLQYALDNAELLKSKLFTHFKGSKVSLPRYYRKKLGITSDDYQEIIKESRQKQLTKLLERGHISKFEFFIGDMVKSRYELSTLLPYIDEVLEAKQKLQKKSCLF